MNSKFQALAITLGVCLISLSGCYDSTPSKSGNGNVSDPQKVSQPPKDAQGEGEKISDKNSSDKNSSDKNSSDKNGKSRTFHFTYSGKIPAAKKDQSVKVWIPIPPTTADQKVEITEKTLPENVKKYTDEVFVNEMFFFESKQEKELPFSITYKVTRQEVQGFVEGKLQKDPTSKSKQFLSANKMVPTTGQPIKLFDEFEAKAKKKGDSSVEKAQQFYDFVYEHLNYDKSKPGYGKGDVLWACDSKTGNCTDFHSLFISVARNRHVPAKFQIGFPIPEKRGTGTIGGYHCWARFFSDSHGWIPVDISEADKDPSKKNYFFGNLTENRILFTTGRDISLNPSNESGPLNYFVFPHVEFDGKVVPKKDLDLKFQYKDLE